MNVDLYCNLMQEIKFRINSIQSILSGKTSTAYKVTNIEFICLQIRKILELISLASLVANKTEFEKQRIKYQQFWNARLIVKDIERINHDFYPKPVVEGPHKDPKYKSDIIDLKDGFLTKEDFIKLYEKCGKLMHSDNPFGSKTDLKYYDNKVHDWLNKIMKLLNTHKITLLNDDNMYLIHMKEQADDLVHGYVFAKK